MTLQARIARASLYIALGLAELVASARPAAAADPGPAQEPALIPGQTLVPPKVTVEIEGQKTSPPPPPHPPEASRGARKTESHTCVLRHASGEGPLWAVGGMAQVRQLEGTCANRDQPPPGRYLLRASLDPDGARTFGFAVELEKGDPKEDKPTQWTIRAVVPKDLPASSGEWSLIQSSGESSEVKAVVRLDVRTLRSLQNTISVIHPEFPGLDGGAKALAVGNVEHVYNRVTFLFPDDFPTGTADDPWTIETRSSGLTIGCAGDQRGPDRRPTTCSSIRTLDVAASQVLTDPAEVLLANQARGLRFRAQIAPANYEQRALPIAAGALVKCPKNRRRDRGMNDVIRWRDGGRTLSADDRSIEEGHCKLVIRKNHVLAAVAGTYPELEASGLVLERDAKQDATPNCIDFEPLPSDSSYGNRLCWQPESRDAANEIMKAREAKARVDDFIRLHGVQALIVRVQQEGNDSPTEVSIAYDYHHAPPLFERALTFPDVELDPARPFDVVVERAPDAPAEITGSSHTLPSGNIVARVRPRGSFGITPRYNDQGIRMFVTVPFSLTTLRVPAVAAELPNSSASRWLDQTNFDTGLLVVVEPWDYSHAKHLWDVPVVFTTGLLFRGVAPTSTAASGPFRRPFWVVGPELTFPLVSGKKMADTSIALGLLYGMDLLEDRPLTRGSHLMLTLGVNIFSLLGATSDDQS